MVLTLLPWVIVELLYIEFLKILKKRNHGQIKPLNKKYSTNRKKIVLNESVLRRHYVSISTDIL